MNMRQLVQLAELKALTRQEVMEVRGLMDNRALDARKKRLTDDVFEVKTLLADEFYAMKWRKKYDPKQTLEEYWAKNWDKGVRRLSRIREKPVILEPIEGFDVGIPGQVVAPPAASDGLVGPNA